MGLGSFLSKNTISMNMKLSIVVPIFNVEPFLEKCLNSLYFQNINEENYEVLLINDGSLDKSGMIAKQYCKEHPTIFNYFEHPNKGLSGTRNRGIREAKGDYIWFVDSDDWIEERCLAQIISCLTGDIDVLAFNGFIPEGGRVEKCKCFADCVADKETLFATGFADAAQMFIFRREFLIENNCFFKEGIKHEDTLFTPITLHKANDIAFYRKPVYHFLQRAGSITTVIDIKRVKDLASNFKILYFYSFEIKNPVLKVGFLNHMAHHIIEMLNYGIDYGPNGEKLIKQIMSEHPEYWKILKNAIDMKSRILYWAVKLSPFPFVTTYRILSKFR